MYSNSDIIEFVTLSGERRKVVFRQILIGIAVSIIWTLIVVILATKFGIYLPPPP